MSEITQEIQMRETCVRCNGKKILERELGAGRELTRNGSKGLPGCQPDVASRIALLEFGQGQRLDIPRPSPTARGGHDVRGPSQDRTHHWRQLWPGLRGRFAAGRAGLSPRNPGLPNPGEGTVNLAWLERGGAVEAETSSLVRHTLPRSKPRRREPVAAGGWLPATGAVRLGRDSG